jgi:abortive infection bacteriophage resistance protein
MANKIFKTYRQLLTLLRNRGINIKNGSAGSRVIRILEEENYYNVINGYKDLFIDKTITSATNEVYKSGTDFNEIYALYPFDREIRIIYLKYLLLIENHFKSVLSHIFSEKHGHENYLKLDNFHCTASTDTGTQKRIASTFRLNNTRELAQINRISTEENVSNVTRLLGDIQMEIARQLSKHNPMVSHYMTTHGYIPLWVLVNVLTFGKVTTFYLNMKEPDKIQIAKTFNLHYKELHKYMSILGFARNKCAHDERFYDIRFVQLLHTKSIPYFPNIGLPRNASGSYTMGLNDAFAITIIFKQMLSKSNFKEFVSAIDIAFKKLDKQLKTIPIDDVKCKMGYPTSWKNLVRF